MGELPWASAVHDGVLIRVKVVPGAKRQRIVGLLGERLKVQIAQPPEDGKANTALCFLLANHLGIAPRQVQLMEGKTCPLKTLHIAQVTLQQVSTLLATPAKG